MQIDLSKKVEEHFKRVEQFAKDAANDVEETYSSRSAALSSLSTILRDLAKTQESIINMERMMRIELITIETVKKFLTQEQIEVFIRELEANLAHE